MFLFLAAANPLIGKLDLSYFVILVNKEQFPVRVPHSITKSSSLGDRTLEISTDRLSVERTTEMAYSSSKLTYSYYNYASYCVCALSNKPHTLIAMYIYLMMQFY